jgi:hypothetical protein
LFEDDDDDDDEESLVCFVVVVAMLQSHEHDVRILYLFFKENFKPLNTFLVRFLL